MTNAITLPAPTDSERLLIDADAMAHRLGLSRSGFYSLLASGRVPAPVRLGRRVFWRTEEIRRWVAAGCPSRAKWKPSLN